MNPEISLVFCSRTSQLPVSLIDNIEKTIGCSYELIVIDNSLTQFSITEAYQTGFERSKGIFLAFLHDDIAFRSQDWGLRLKEHLSVPGTGICGIGGRDTLVRVPSSWNVSLPYIHLVQSDKTRGSTKIKHRPVGFTGSKLPVIMLDGVMLCMHRELMNHIRFDTGLKGFHAYDFDTCIRASAAGFQNYVMYNVDIEHFSKGTPDKSYYRGLIQVFKKHKDRLPLSVSKLNNLQQNKLEKEGLNRLIRKMILKGFETDEIMQTYSDFYDLIFKKNKNRLNFRCKRTLLLVNIAILRTIAPLISR